MFILQDWIAILTNIENIYFDQSRPELQPFLPSNPKRILEIGCGSGNFITHFRNDVEYWGIEPNPPSVAKATLKLNKVICGYYDDVAYQIPDDYFDLVICNDVLEHIDRYQKFLSEISKKLNGQGYIVGSVPNVRFVTNLFNLLIKKDWQYTKSGILDKTHLRFFTEKSLRRELLDMQFSIERFGGLNPVKYEGSIFKFIVKYVMVILFGWDVRFLQFGFRIKPKSTANFHRENDAE